jgi:hypothetical protein
MNFSTEEPVRPEVVPEASSEVKRNGAYGLQLAADGEASRALGEASNWLLPANPQWPHWRIESAPVVSTDTGEVQSAGVQRPDREELLSDSALLLSTTGGWIHLDRAMQRTRFYLPGPLGAAALVHPLLTSTAAIAAHWFGRTPFHAGAFALDGRIWGVLGDREMGKSSLLMGLHACGVAVVSDDLVVVERGRVFAGPRCLDLREGAAKQFGAGRPLGRVGGRDRWRVDLPPVADELPLAGWVALGWSDEVAIQPVGAAERLAMLAMNRAVTARGELPRGLLDAVALPVVLFSRPRDWAELDGGLHRLLAFLNDV